MNKEKSVNFLNCEIDISYKVFIPRQETEFWTKEAIKKIRQEEKRKKVKVLDIFAGSGCIGIAVLKNTKRATVDFIDIDKKAIKQIQLNLLKNKISQKRYQIFCSDMFAQAPNKKYDFILANPPYVALERKKEVDREVLKNEPHRALFAGKDGLFYIRKLLKEIDYYLNCEGYLFMEFDPLQKMEIKKIIKRDLKGYKHWFKKDQYKKDRFLILKKLC